MTQFSKLALAKVAIEAAIEMHLSKRYVPAVVLSGAAGRISDDLCREKGILTALQRCTPSEIELNSRKIRTLFEELYNSAKHAERKPLEVVEVNVNESLMLIQRALLDLKSLGVQDIIGVSQIFDCASSRKMNP